MERYYFQLNTLKTKSLNDLSQNLMNLSRVLNPQKKTVLIERLLKS